MFDFKIYIDFVDYNVCDVFRYKYVLLVDIISIS